MIGKAGPVSDTRSAPFAFSIRLYTWQAAFRSPGCRSITFPSHLACRLDADCVTFITALQLLFGFFTQSSRVGWACKGHKKPATLNFCPLFFGHRAACGFTSGRCYAADKLTESSPIPRPLHLTWPGAVGKIQLKTYFIRHAACCMLYAVY